MSETIWQSPVSPGISWYEASVPERPAYPAMDGSETVDVAIVGGGFTGLQAALNLARGGARVTLIEAHRFGDGGSGRNGGQMGTGQRSAPEEIEADYGYERSKALFDMAEAAKRHLLDFAAREGIDIDYRPGQMNVVHKRRYIDDYRKSAEIAATRYGYPHQTFMDGKETAERLGSTRYLAGIRDTGTGHLHPMKLVVGLARVAAASGAHLYEQTKATRIEGAGGRVTIETPRGTITAARALIACNAYVGGLEPVTAAHIMPIGSFIGATEPLDAFPRILPGGEAVADSRFVVRYFRKTLDNRLLFGGRETYAPDDAADIHVHIRKQIAEIYPELKNIRLTHAWGGYVGITLPRQPFVREVMPNVTAIGGYSGHGVMLSNYCGRLYADLALGRSTDLELFRAFDVPAFPGGMRFRSALLFLALNWYALRDRF
ncbi:NAD(P)/FAD-dependent oxidoreductase [Ensifer soli]|uniref:NAD(P)/FAD-dependent oxidoreductase n=1 Tax=Ciceribacter sp. sgz301302 TaxID=3342379 RepID=UPI0035B8FD86